MSQIKLRNFIFAVLVWLVAFPVVAVDYINPNQIAPDPDSGEIISNDGTSMTWASPATLPSSTSLDNAYDNGDTIDFTDDTGPVQLSFPNNGTLLTVGGYNLSSLYLLTQESADATTSMIINQTGGEASVGTNYLVMGYDLAGTPDVDYVFGRNFALNSASAQIAGGLTLGDAATQGSIIYGDGDAETLTITLPDTTANYTLNLPDSASLVDGYLWRWRSLGGGVWQADLVDPDTITPNPVGRFTNSASAPATVLAGTNNQGANLAAESGGIVEYGAYLNSWTVSLGADTITISLVINGVTADSFTTSAGTAGYKSSGAVTELFAADDQIAVTISGVLDDVIVWYGWKAEY